MDTISTVRQKIKNIDYPLLIIILFLSIFGLMMIYSSSSTLSYLNFDTTNHFFMKQLQWLLVGMFFLAIAAILPYHLYSKLSPIFVFISIALLILVLLPGIGVERNNSQRWIQLGSFLFQPSEFIKLFMLIYFAHFYSKKQKIINQFQYGVLPPLLILAVVFLLILQQPDLGSAALILIACGMIVLCSGVKQRHLLMLGSIGILGISYFIYSSPYRLERLTSFANPFDNPLGDGYQLLNSYIAIGTGGFAGNGLGGSVQKLGFLPEAHTDFIMAVILEELGAFGLILVIGAYIFIMFRGIAIAKACTSMFPKLLAIGITFQIILQVIFNLGAVSGLLPITGIPLPLISYGGSSTLVSMISLGILLQISAKNNLTNGKAS
ncbi:putative lipid II flippase FtsW [Virgibacillus sp. NKC19-3]|uniref:putative lipid II flippase FtsW n=1 Tax=Virgibacillus saliphilus TaxID=2831674 RepID=UPI001C9B5754|nr:putative lipid II flippase FtsW [Virgibacillus sp. NKC19-3]MBY7144057.1 putative lipid II flippase FtsW [Virgibacillus sp. NKC19-3]